ncbi:MAG: BatD family protein, partial [Candidatus Aminicenantes bacterium]|nr:BatD family protein [Candidatus Aminicenantes bacterium]
MRKFRGTVLAAVLLTAPVGGQDPAVRAFLDRTSVARGQQFTLTVEVSGKGASGAGEPRLPPMEEFAAFLGRRISQQYRLVNGRMSTSRTFIFHFRATREGEFEIGAVQVRLDGNIHKSAPLRIRVGSGGRPVPTPPGGGRPADTTSPADLFVRATADRERVYRNQALVVTYKIYTGVGISSYGISKQPETAGFWVEDYPQPRQPRTEGEVIGGRRYTVALIKKMVLFPTGAG